jgi:hypothetical protein
VDALSPAFGGARLTLGPSSSKGWLVGPSTSTPHAWRLSVKSRWFRKFRPTTTAVSQSPRSRDPQAMASATRLDEHAVSRLTVGPCVPRK